MKSRGAIVSSIRTFQINYFFHQIFFIFYSNLIHEQLDDHDDSLEPLDDLKHLLLIDLLLEEDHPDRVNLQDDLLEPELVGLMGDDEQVLIMNLGA